MIRPSPVPHPSPPIYFDHNATTPVRPEVLEEMLPYLRDHFGNPNSVYFLGQRARKAVEKARAQVAALIGARFPDEIVFTSCGSESDSFGVQGAALRLSREEAGRPAKRHLIVSGVEHDAVLESVRLLESRGINVGIAGVDSRGRVDAEEIRGLIGPDTGLVSVMFANNEVGTLQPIREIASLCRERGTLFHTDAVQAVGKVPVSVQDLGIDLLSLSGHKLNAPKGIGALYIRRGVRLDPLITGHQERERRGGTENVPGIVALGAACELAFREMENHSLEVLRLRERLERGLLNLPGAKLNGHPDLRLPNTAHFSFEGTDGHALVVALDLEGICVSSGPACSSGSVEPSHVLKAMGIPRAAALGSVRISLGWGNTPEQVDRFLEIFPGVLERLSRLPAFG